MATNENENENEVNRTIEIRTTTEDEVSNNEVHNTPDPNDVPIPKFLGPSVPSDSEDDDSEAKKKQKAEDRLVDDPELKIGPQNIINVIKRTGSKKGKKKKAPQTQDEKERALKIKAQKKEENTKQNRRSRVLKEE